MSHFKTVLCYFMLGFSVLVCQCYVTLCTHVRQLSLRYVMLYDMLRYTTLCPVGLMLRNAMLLYVALLDVRPTLRYVMICYVMLCYVLLCYVKLCYVILRDVMLCLVELSPCKNPCSNSF